MTAVDPSQRLSVAPMMAWTDRHCRYFHRQLAPRARLYTEMVTTGALLHGPRERLLAYHPCEHPLALQVGGCEPKDMGRAARIGADHGFDEINVNVGCPSDRVQNGRFGACLMAEPARVADCVAAMRAASTVPVTVKTRIGIDRHDDYDFLAAFAQAVAAAGCQALIVHARKAWLSGLSPRQNRELPPLRYDVVYRLKREFPALNVIVNGGVDSVEAACRHLAHVDGVMLGRAAYRRPFVLAQIHRRLFDSAGALPERGAVIRSLLPYIAEQQAKDVAVKHITRHILGLYHGQPGGRRWRRVLSEQARNPHAGPELLIDALRAVEPPKERLAA